MLAVRLKESKVLFEMVLSASTTRETMAKSLNTIAKLKAIKFAFE